LFLSYFFKSKLSKDLSLSYIAQAAVVMSGFFQVFLLTKHLGLEVYGQFAIIVSSGGLISSFMTARSSEAITRFFKREEMNENYRKAKSVLFYGMAIDLASAFLLILVFYFLSFLVAEHLLKSMALQAEFFLYSGVIFFLFLRGGFWGFFHSREMFGYTNVLIIVDSSVKAIVLFVLVLNYPGVGLHEVLVALVAASVVTFLFSLSLFVREYNEMYKYISIEFDPLIFRAYFKFNFQTFISGSLKSGNANLDTLILSYFTNTSMVAIYSVLKKISSPIMVMVTPLSMLFYPKFISYYDSGKKHLLYSAIYTVTFKVFIISIMYLSVSYYFLYDVLDLMNIDYSIEYSNYYLFVCFILLIKCITWWSRIFSNVIDPKISLYLNLFVVSFILTFVTYLSYQYHLYGLLIGFSLMQIVVLIVLVISLFRHVK